jgi:lipopolysaccharide transport system permease protein
LPNTSTLLYLAVFSLTALWIGICMFKIYEKKLVLEL